MISLVEQYKLFGISKEVFAFSEEILSSLKKRFDEIDENA